MSQEIYCIKCKTKTETVNPVEVNSKSGFAKMLQGQCKECNCKKSKILSSNKPKAIKEIEVVKEKEVAVKEKDVLGKLLKPKVKRVRKPKIAEDSD
jgi:hypothetical protein